MPLKRREALSRYFLDVSKIILAIGVLTPLLSQQKTHLITVLMFSIVGLIFCMLGYYCQPKE